MQDEIQNYLMGKVSSIFEDKSYDDLKRINIKSWLEEIKSEQPEIKINPKSIKIDLKFRKFIASEINIDGYFVSSHDEEELISYEMSFECKIKSKKYRMMFSPSHYDIETI